MNSLLYGLISMVASVLISAPAAYVLARKVFKGSAAIKNSFVIAMAIPQIMIVMPLFSAAVRTGLSNSKFLLLILYTGMALPYTTTFLTAFFSNQSAVIAATDLQEAYPERAIRVVDSLSASLGQGLLAWYASRKRQEGCSLDALTQWLEDNRLHLCHWFTVDDLMYLKRGGRINAATAVMGTMLSIKPVLHMDDAGHLISVGKARGRKASIQAMAQKAAELGWGYENPIMFISHGDCLEDAKYLSDLLKRNYGVKEIYINYVGAVIGSHSGPGTLALFFMGEHR